MSVIMDTLIATILDIYWLWALRF